MSACEIFTSGIEPSIIARAVFPARRRHAQLPRTVSFDDLTSIIEHRARIEQIDDDDDDSSTPPETYFPEDAFIAREPNGALVCVHAYFGIRFRFLVLTACR